MMFRTTIDQQLGAHNVCGLEQTQHKSRLEDSKVAASLQLFVPTNPLVGR